MDFSQAKSWSTCTVGCSSHRPGHAHSRGAAASHLAARLTLELEGGSLLRLLCLAGGLDVVAPHHRLCRRGACGTRAWVQGRTCLPICLSVHETRPCAHCVPAPPHGEGSPASAPAHAKHESARGLPHASERNGLPQPCAPCVLQSRAHRMAGMPPRAGVLRDRGPIAERSACFQCLDIHSHKQTYTHAHPPAACVLPACGGMVIASCASAACRLSGVNAMGTWGRTWATAGTGQ